MITNKACKQYLSQQYHYSDIGHINNDDGYCENETWNANGKSTTPLHLSIYIRHSDRRNVDGNYNDFPAAMYIYTKLIIN